MHIISTKKELDFGNQGKFPPGEYLLDDRNSGKLLVTRPCLTLTHFNCDSAYHGNSVLITGGGAYGDLLLLTPVIKALKEAGVQRIAVACFKQYADVLADVCEVVPYPTPRAMISSIDIVISIEHAWSEESAKSDKHLTDIFAKIVGVELTDKKATYTVIPEESQFANSKYPRTAKKRIGIQCNASAANRTYLHTEQVGAMLLQKGYEIVILGAPNEVNVEKSASGIINCTADKLTFRQSVAVLSTCDAFVGPDSSLLHYAGALDIPAVGLFGAFHWKQRTAYAPKTFALQGCKDCDIAPCHFHGSTGRPFPENGPCAKTGYCTALASIAPERVVAKLESLISSS